MNSLSAYEKQQLKAIMDFKVEEPEVVGKTFGIVIEPLAWLIKKVIPEAATRGALSASNWAAKWMTDTKDVIRDGGVESVMNFEIKIWNCQTI